MKPAPQRYRAFPIGWRFFEQLTEKQQAVVRLLVFGMAHELTVARIGDRKFLVPPGGVLFSERRLAQLSHTGRGNVIRTLEKIKAWEQADVFQQGSATWPKPKGPQDPGEDPSEDPLHDPDHRISPSLLLWRNPERFRVRTIELIYWKDPSEDPQKDPGEDPGTVEKPKHLHVVAGA